MTPVFLRGQSASLTIDKAGEYNYICGLHPTMKGVIEVKSLETRTTAS